ncbi:MAG: glycerophosphodiester phosphodiesterase family protein [Deltaproteobacteria bacterium]
MCGFRDSSSAFLIISGFGFQNSKLTSETGLYVDEFRLYHVCVSTYNKKRGGLFPKILTIIAVLIVLNVILHFVFVNLTRQGGVYAISHRGAAGIAPENTMASIRAGAESGTTFIEIDVRLTADRAFVLMHDGTVDRTTGGTGYVRDLEWAYVKGLDAGGYFGSRFEGETVPDLGRVLEYMKGKSPTLVIEVKSPGERPGTRELLAELIREHGMEKEIAVVSFDGEWVTEFGRIMPDVTLGALYIYPLLPPPAEEVRYLSVFWPSYILDPTLVWRTHRSGHEVWAWNVNNHLVARFLSWKGVDGIVLDRPGLLSEN